ncbi:DUF4190 domain-containing protein [Streptomyces sp. NBC_01497]|uniref:DUF4190 domain-containing protein n=1 Tax=Streptomyces sp. NBC_01497 TaxID=2903885 RepID=UPI002E328353|nr:DUF4190 domain-containing protein [Streptomyces sp. NBC_01497]
MPSSSSPSEPPRQPEPSEHSGSPGPGEASPWGAGGPGAGSSYGVPSAPPYADAGPRPRPGNGMAVAALVLGIVACVLFWTVFGGIVLGVVAIVLGFVGARRARGGRAPRRGMAVVGVVLGVLGLIAGGVILGLGVSILNSDGFKSYSDCLQHAHGRADQHKCADDFSHDVSH